MEKPKVGIGGIIIKDRKILLSKRKGEGKFGQGTYGTFGGHLEFGESFEDCLKREAMEEMGIEIKVGDFICVSNLIDGNHHYVDLVFSVEIVNGDPKIMEPEKHESLEWHDLDKLPENIFCSIEKALKSLKTREKCFDSKSKTI